MKIAVIGGNGKAGQLITQEALTRGHDVTAIVRSGTAKVAGAKTLTRDLFDLTYSDLQDYAVIIDAFGAWTPETLPQHVTSIRHLAGILGGKPNRLLVVGGAGSLYVDAAHTMQVMDGPDFPEVFVPVAKATGEQLDVVRTLDDVQWTYLCPAGDFQADGVRSGKYILGGEELTLNSKGESVISYADYAIAMVDEAENARHVQQRFSVVADY